jgi:hypothetical protein
MQLKYNKESTLDKSLFEVVIYSEGSEKKKIMKSEKELREFIEIFHNVLKRLSLMETEISEDLIIYAKECDIVLHKTNNLEKNKDIKIVSIKYINEEGVEFDVTYSI